MAELPAAATSAAPWSRAALIASCMLLLQAPGLPSDRLITLAGFGLAGTPSTATPAAQRMPSMMSEV